MDTFSLIIAKAKWNQKKRKSRSLDSSERLTHEEESEEQTPAQESGDLDRWTGSAGQLDLKRKKDEFTIIGKLHLIFDYIMYFFDNEAITQY